MSLKPSHGHKTPGIDDVLMMLRTAIKLIEAGCPNAAQDWAYKAADTLQEENEKRIRTQAEIENVWGGE